MSMIAILCIKTQSLRVYLNTLSAFWRCAVMTASDRDEWQVAGDRVQTQSNVTSYVTLRSASTSRVSRQFDWQWWRSTCLHCYVNTQISTVEESSALSLHQERNERHTQPPCWLIQLAACLSTTSVTAATTAGISCVLPARLHSVATAAATASSDITRHHVTTPCLNRKSPTDVTIRRAFTSV